jgi:hypothetical protein
MDWYRACFAPARGETAVGEATPTYMLRPETIARMASTLPDAKLIALLRDPADRAYSHYRHWSQQKGEHREFAQVVDDELARGRPMEAGIWDPEHPERYSYLAHGRYVEQLAWLEERYPRERIHVVLFDDLEREPVPTFRDTCRFLGIDDETVPENVGSVANSYRYYQPEWLWKIFVRVRIGRFLPGRAAGALYRAMVRDTDPYPPMDPAVRARLVEHYAPDRAALEERLGRDLSGWA